VLLALTGAYAPPPTDRSKEGKEEEEEEEAWSEREQALSCGDFEALVGIWTGGERMDELLRSLVPGTQLPCFAGTKVPILTLTGTNGRAAEVVGARYSLSFRALLVQKYKY
jgi:hypothetical protein